MIFNVVRFVLKVFLYCIKLSILLSCMIDNIYVNLSIIFVFWKIYKLKLLELGIVDDIIKF